MAWVVVIAGLVGYVVVSVVSAGGLWRYGGSGPFSTANVGRTIERPFVTRGEIAAAGLSPEASPELLAKLRDASGQRDPGATLHVGFNDPANVMSQTMFRVGWPVELVWWRVHETGDIRTRSEHSIYWRRPPEAVVGRALRRIDGYVWNWSIPGGVTQRTAIWFDSLLTYVPIFLLIWLMVAVLRRIVLRVTGRPRPSRVLAGDIVRRRRRWTWRVALLATLGLMLIPREEEMMWPMGPAGANFAPLDTGLTREEVNRLAATAEGRASIAREVLNAPGDDEFIVQLMYLVPTSVGTVRHWTSAVMGDQLTLHVVHRQDDVRGAEPPRLTLIDRGVAIQLPRSAGDRSTAIVNIGAAVLEPIGVACLFVLAVFGLCGAPGWWLSRRDRRRVARGLCVGCGYDLAGLREMKEG